MSIFNIVEYYKSERLNEAFTSQFSLSDTRNQIKSDKKKRYNEYFEVRAWNFKIQNTNVLFWNTHF